MNATAGALAALDYRCPRHGVDPGYACPGEASGRCSARVRVGWAHVGLDAIAAVVTPWTSSPASPIDAGPTTIRSSR